MYKQTMMRIPATRFGPNKSGVTGVRPRWRIRFRKKAGHDLIVSCFQACSCPAFRLVRVLLSGLLKRRKTAPLHEGVRLLHQPLYEKNPQRIFVSFVLGVLAIGNRGRAEWVRDCSFLEAMQFTNRTRTIRWGFGLGRICIADCRRRRKVPMQSLCQFNFRRLFSSDNRIKH